MQLAGRGTSITAPNALSLGRWYHIAVVDNGSEMTIYIDGNAEISVDSSSSKAINLGFYYNSPFAIGMSAADVRYFNGYVSEARVWKRALTPTELKNNQCYVDPATAEGLFFTDDIPACTPHSTARRNWTSWPGHCSDTRGCQRSRTPAR